MVPSEPPHPFGGTSRNLVITLGVVIFHIAALWAMQTGLLRRAVELIVPAEILVEFIEPPAPQVMPPAPTPPLPVKRPLHQAAAPVRTAAPQPLAIADLTPAPTAPVGVVEPAPVAPPMAAAPVAEAAPAPVRVELPSSDADYLKNPRPPYPRLSKALGEQGTVLIRIFVGVDGKVQKAEIKQSSGFDRLDQSALTTVLLRWQFVPGKRAGVPEAMWVTAPLAFVLE